MKRLPIITITALFSFLVSFSLTVNIGTGWYFSVLSSSVGLDPVAITVLQGLAGGSVKIGKGSGMTRNR